MTPKQLQIQSANTMKAKTNDESVVVERVHKHLYKHVKDWILEPDPKWDCDCNYYRIKEDLIPDIKNMVEDGWIEHTRTTCPVDGDVIVDARWDNNEIEKVHYGVKAYQIYWQKSNVPASDITHYRLHKEENLFNGEMTKKEAVEIIDEMDEICIICGTTNNAHHSAECIDTDGKGYPPKPLSDEEIHNRVVNKGWFVIFKNGDYCKFLYSKKSESKGKDERFYFMNNRFICNMSDLRQADIVERIEYKE